jgi:hypothetical protein
MMRINSPSTSKCTTVSNLPAEPNPITAALLVIAAGVLHDEQWIIEYCDRLFEPHSMLTLVVRGLLVIPDKSSALMFVEAIHDVGEPISMYLQCKYECLAAYFSSV